MDGEINDGHEEIQDPKKEIKKEDQKDTKAMAGRTEEENSGTRDCPDHTLRTRPARINTLVPSLSLWVNEHNFRGEL